MKQLLSRFVKTFFHNELDLRGRLFNILALAGTAVSLASAIAAVALREPLQNAAIYLVFALFAAALLWYSKKSGRYQRCYLITIITVFLFGFPLFFFSAGGYYGPMSHFFIFAFVFTAFMLEGKRAIVMVSIELVVYIGICLYAYYFFVPDELYIGSGMVVSNDIFGFVVVGLVLSTVMLLQFRLYNAQQKKLDEQNIVLAQVNRAKTEFLSNASHEMKTPLTVVSVNIQTVADILSDMDEQHTDPEAIELLTDAQSEIMRLARMVSGMLSLSSLSEDADKGKVNLTALLRNAGDMLRLLLSKRSNALQIEAEDGLMVYGNTDLLSQVAVNLIQNSHAHTENDTIRLTAKRVASVITIIVSDSGGGIAPELLPHVFERGVTDGGTGYGLFLCKTVIESHGGNIEIASRQGEGTTVTITLPTYEGQFGGDTV